MSDVNAAAETMDLDDVRKRAGWALDTTRMAKSGYAPRKAELARWVIALVAEVERLQADYGILEAIAREREQRIDRLRAERDAARAERENWKFSAEQTVLNADALRVEKQQLEEQVESWSASHAEKDKELWASVQREQRLQEALREIAADQNYVSASERGRTAGAIARAALAAEETPDA